MDINTNPEHCKQVHYIQQLTTYPQRCKAITIRYIQKTCQYTNMNRMLQIHSFKDFIALLLQAFLHIVNVGFDMWRIILYIIVLCFLRGLLRYYSCIVYSNCSILVSILFNPLQIHHIYLTIQCSDVTYQSSIYSELYLCSILMLSSYGTVSFRIVIVFLIY